MKTRIFIVRHTETVGNIEKRLTGRQDYSLTKKGEKLVVYLTKELQNIKFNAIYSSTSGRAVATVAFFCVLYKYFTIYQIVPLYFM